MRTTLLLALVFAMSCDAGEKATWTQSPYWAWESQETALARRKSPASWFGPHGQHPPEGHRLAFIAGWNPVGQPKRRVWINSNDGVVAADLVWFNIGKTVVLPKWFTSGKDAQKISSDKLQEAWEKRTPGVYKMDYSAPVVRKEVFKGHKVEVN